MTVWLLVIVINGIWQPPFEITDWTQCQELARSINDMRLPKTAAQCTIRM